MPGTDVMPERRSSTSRIKNLFKSTSLRRPREPKEDGKGEKRSSWTESIASAPSTPNGGVAVELDGGEEVERAMSSSSSNGSPPLPHNNIALTVLEPTTGQVREYRSLNELLITVHTTVDAIRNLHQRVIVDFDVSINDRTFTDLHRLGTRMGQLCQQLTQEITNPAIMASLTTSSSKQVKAALRTYQNVIQDYLGSVRLQMEERYRTIRPEATEEEVATALRDVASRNVSVPILRVDEREEIQPLIRAVERRSRAVNIAEQTLRELEQYVDAIGAAELGRKSARGTDGLIRDFYASECIIAPLGDVILVFDGAPRSVFQVSSQALTSVSPLFSYALHPYEPSDRFQRPPPPADLLDELPKAPAEVTNPSLPPFLRMPQVEPNERGAMSTLLYAAHARHDKVPRTIEFREFVAIAAVCHRYRCTAPVEIFVECFWLPQWQSQVGQRGYEDFLFISYVFGLEKIFELTSKTFILQSRSEKGPLEPHNLPQSVWRRLNQAKAMQFAKILERCNLTLSAYLPSPGSVPVSRGPGDEPASTRAQRRRSFQLTRQTKCPFGSHACDAANLGWIMMVLNEVGVPHQFSRQNPETNWIYWQGLNLQEVFTKLCSAPSAHSFVHDECDYAGDFRNAMCDLYNAVRPLYVRDVNERYAARRGAGSNQVGGPAADEPAQTALISPHAELARLSAGTVETATISEPGAGRSSYQAYARRMLPSTTLSSEESGPVAEESAAMNAMTADVESRSVISTEIDTWTERCVSPTPTMTSGNANNLPTLTQLATRNAAVAATAAVTTTTTTTASHQVDDLREADKIYWKQHAHKERITIADKELIISRKHILRIGEERGLPPIAQAVGEAGDAEETPMSATSAPLPLSPTSPVSDPRPGRLDAGTRVSGIQSDEETLRALEGEGREHDDGHEG